MWEEVHDFSCPMRAMKLSKEFMPFTPFLIARKFRTMESAFRCHLIQTRHANFHSKLEQLIYNHQSRYLPF